MRTNIDIDDKLMRAAMRATGAKTKKATVEAALQRLVEIRSGEADRQAYMRRRGTAVTQDGWLEKWLASGWKQSTGNIIGTRARGKSGNAHQH